MQQQIQRTILWVIFFSSLFFLWDAWQRHQGQPGFFAPPQEKTAAATNGSQKPDAKPVSNEVPQAASVAAGGADKTQIPGVTADASKANQQTDAASGASKVPGDVTATLAPGDFWVLQNKVLKLAVSPEGGQLVRSELLTQRELNDPSKNVVLLHQEGQNHYLAQQGWISAQADKRFPTHQSRFQRIEQGQTHLVLEASEGDLKVRRRYQLEPDSYVVRIDETVQNLGVSPLAPIAYRQLLRDSKAPAGESQFYSTYTGPVVYTVDFPSIEKGKADHVKQASDGWLGIIQHHFIAAWLPQDQRQREYFTRRVEGNPVLYSVGALERFGELAPGASQSTVARLLIGPQDQRMLAAIAPGLDLAVDYGWLAMFAKPIFWLLEQMHGLSNNWGLAIILLTVIIKTLFFPLQSASYKSMARMKAVTPRMMAIRERYGSDRIRMNQAMMELYKEEKINPLGGCLPIVVQIPVFIALYWVLLASSEMRFAPFLYLDNLAAPDALFGTYFGVPIGLMPILMAVTMFIQTKLNPTPPDPVQAKLMMFMPIVFSVMFFFFPSGLVLYWLVNNVYSIAQQWVITRRIEAQSAKERRS
ncbi:MAG: membrane protein insertase YidC [Betaproteobacteria bacterium]|nr:membrane protein insertase YidC [Betaproteobacteria bacterium]